MDSGLNEWSRRAMRVNWMISVELTNMQANRVSIINENRIKLGIA